MENALCLSVIAPFAKKTRKNKSCDLALLIYTSKIVIIKREGKQIGALVMRAYKKTHLSIEIVCMCEMG